MSRENIATAELLYEALVRGELPETLFAEDVEYVNPDGAIETGVRTGLAALRAAGESVQEAWEYWRMYPERYVAAGEEVAVVMRYEARARASGVKVEGRESALLGFREGKIARYEWFQRPEDALAALAGG